MQKYRYMAALSLTIYAACGGVERGDLCDEFARKFCVRSNQCELTSNMASCFQEVRSYCCKDSCTSKLEIADEQRNGCFDGIDLLSCQQIAKNNYPAYCGKIIGL